MPPGTKPCASLSEAVAVTHARPIVDTDPVLNVKEETMSESHRTFTAVSHVCRWRTPSVVASLGAVAFLASSCAGSGYGELRDELASARPKAVAVAQIPATAADALPESADLYDLLRYARDHNPGAVAAYHRWHASTERIPQERALPDPQLLLDQIDVSVGPRPREIEVSQMVPWVGTLGLRGQVAAHEARAAREEFHALLDMLYYDVVDTYVEYYYVSQSADITQALIELMADAEAVAQARYRDGSGSFADVIRAQLEQDRLDNELISLQSETRPIRARLNAALSRPADASLAAPRELPAESLALSDDEVLASAASGNPRLLALDEMVAREERAASVAARRYLPDLMFGITYMDRDQSASAHDAVGADDDVMAMVGLNIPIWWGSYNAGRREAQARRRAAEAERHDQENVLSAECARVLFAYHDAERRVALYRDELIPRATEALNAARAGFAAGDVDFSGFLDTERLLLDFQLSLDRSRADRLSRLAQLRMLIGGAFEASADW